ncbi:MAG: nitroreductase family protein [Armatimonadetes bacterium]|nr:nitroreductase family protein [Armatimonadota bacterium]
MFTETPSQAWSLRYGDQASSLPDLGRFLNHRTVRQYSNEPIPEEVIAGLVAAAQSAATSSNLQLYSMVSVQEPEARKQIAVMCSDQKQIHTCSWFFAFVADHFRLAKAAKEAGQNPAGLDYLEFFTMAAIDAALAAERMVCAAESLGIASCYIGALRNDPVGVRDLLGLPSQTYGLFGLCLGYPAEDAKAEIKPRLKQPAIWFREKYDENPDIAEYNARMKEFYESQGMSGDVDWSMRSGRRVDGNHMSGRDSMLDYVREQGFLKR